MRFYGSNSAGNDRVNFMQWTRANEDITFYRDVNIDGSYYIKGNNFESNSDTNVEFHGNGVLMFRLEDEATVEPEVVLPWGNSLRTPTIKTNEIKPRSYSIHAEFYGGNTAGDGEVNFLTYNRTSEELTVYKRANMDTGAVLAGDVITSNAIHGDDCFANRFRVRHATQDAIFDGANTTEDGRITFMFF